MNSATERSLLPSAKVVCITAGNRAAVLARRDALAEAHLSLVTQTAERVARSLPPSFDVEDLIGVGHLALLHAATAYRPEAHGGAPFDAFARPRIFGAMIDSIRRSKWKENTRPSIDDAPDIAAEEFNVVESIDDGRRRIQLKRAIARLTPKHRQIIELHYDGERTLAKIAAEMGCSPSMASTFHQQALDALREELAHVAA